MPPRPSPHETGAAPQRAARAGAAACRRPRRTGCRVEQPTRTSAEAAAAIGCGIAEIAKSVVFRARKAAWPSWSSPAATNRVCEKKVAALVGETLGRADADFVREATGYVIGGVSPIGHAKPVKLVLDEDLQQFETMWAAAGTPFSVFPLTPEKLLRITDAQWAAIRSD